MHKVLIIGAGEIGTTIAKLLSCNEKDVEVSIADIGEAYNPKIPNVRFLVLDSKIDSADLSIEIKDFDTIINAGPHSINRKVMDAVAINKNTNYLDLSEDVNSRRRIEEIAENSDMYWIPCCGLAPGFTQIIAANLINKFKRVTDCNIRVGSLPQQKINKLGYGIMWSVDGLINEYLNPCEIVIDNKYYSRFPSLQLLEEIEIAGTTYEAFTTSGGLGSLCEEDESHEIFHRNIKNLNYKTLRYPGHLEFFRFIMDDLHYHEDREGLKGFLTDNLPAIINDKVVIHVDVTGYINCGPDTYKEKINYTKVINAGYTDCLSDRMTAIQITTAQSLCAVFKLMIDGKLPHKGYVKQEEINFKDFVNTKYGDIYRE